MGLWQEARSLPSRDPGDSEENLRRKTPAGTGPVSRDLLGTAVGWSVILQMHWLHRNGHKCGENCHCDDHF